MSSVPAAGSATTPARRAALVRRARVLAAAAVAVSALEGLAAVAAGAAASSIALLAFGLDSLIEMSAGLVILWQFSHRMPESRERAAGRWIAVSFYALAGYVGIEAVRSLWAGDEAGSSALGIAVAVASLLVMPPLAWAQRRTGRELRSASVVAQSRQTLLCAALAGVLLVGLALNAALGWWWADPVVALIVAVLALQEGREAWRGEEHEDGESQS